MLQPTTLRNQILETNPGYARGGSIRGDKKLTLAHLAPHELDVMDHLQGGKELNKKSGARSYSHLEELLKNPHLKKRICDKAKQCKAEGGEIEDAHAMHDDVAEDPYAAKLQRLLDMLLHKKKVSPQDLTKDEIDFLAANGDHGDREMAQIGPRTHHLFDQIAGHRTRNPKTGLPEYWSIGGALSGLWDSVKGSGALESLKQGAIGAGKGLLNAGANHLARKGSERLGLNAPEKFNLFGDQKGDGYELGSSLVEGGLAGARAKANAIAKKRLGYNEQDAFGNDRAPSIGDRFKMGAKNLAQAGADRLAKHAPDMVNAASQGGSQGLRGYMDKSMDGAQQQAQEGTGKFLANKFGGGAAIQSGNLQPQQSGLRSQEPIVPPQGQESYA